VRVRLPHVGLSEQQQQQQQSTATATTTTNQKESYEINAGDKKRFAPDLGVMCKENTRT